MTVSGSPPRVRGKVDGVPTLEVDVWITPACAGKRRRASACTWSSWDHPRVCGEKVSVELSADAYEGSPPRVRGKAPVVDKAAHWRWDHPRVCGEKFPKSSLLVLSLGSPPRVRGKASVLFGWCRNPRITPACAGKSHLAKLSTSGGRDHPRVCGEKCKMTPVILS